MNLTKEQIVAYINVVKNVADIIRELGSVPSGVLYARLTGIMTLEQYQRILGHLKNSGLIRESNHLLTWVAPAPVEAK